MRNKRKQAVILGMVVLMLCSTACGNNAAQKDSEKETNTQKNSEQEQQNTASEWQKVEGTLHKELVEDTIGHVSVHDPSIVSDVDENGDVNYYVFGTHITAASSTDLVSWQIFTNGYEAEDNTIFGNLSENLAEPFAWAGEDDADCIGGFAVWAPDVFYNPNYINDDGSKGAYMMYFCTSSTYCRSAIAYAVSDNIMGDYTYKGTLVYSGFTQVSLKDNNSDVDKIWTNTNIDELMEEGRIEEGYNDDWGMVAYNTDYAPNAIDPTIFIDAEGRMWMTYGSWSGGIYLLELDPETGDAIYPGENGETEDGRVIDKYFGTRIAGGHTISGEGPYILYDEETEYYYLYTTYNFLDSVSGYNMRLFRSKDPQGPYLDAAGNNAAFASKGVNQYDIGIKVMGNYQFSRNLSGYRSPGHCSSFIDQDGQMYLAYHTRFSNSGERFELRIHQQFVNEEGWPVTAVFENHNDQISETGYEVSEIVGNYEFINHGTTSDGASVKKADNITLNEDGTITGDVTGSWTEKEGSYFASFEIDGITYNGVFFKQHDESVDVELVMTFTAIGSNNMTIWGVKE